MTNQSRHMGNTWWVLPRRVRAAEARSLRAPQPSHGVRRFGGRLGRSSPDGAAIVIFNAEDAFVHPSEFHWPEVYVPESIVDFFQSTYSPASVCVTQTQCFFQRMPLLRLTRRTSKWPGYSRGASVRGSIRGDGW